MQFKYKEIGKDIIEDTFDNCTSGLRNMSKSFTCFEEFTKETIQIRSRQKRREHKRGKRSATAQEALDKECKNLRQLCHPINKLATKYDLTMVAQLELYRMLQKFNSMFKGFPDDNKKLHRVYGFFVAYRFCYHFVGCIQLVDGTENSCKETYDLLMNELMEIGVNLNNNSTLKFGCYIDIEQDSWANRLIRYRGKA